MSDFEAEKKKESKYIVMFEVISFNMEFYKIQCIQASKVENKAEVLAALPNLYNI